MSMKAGKISKKPFFLQQRKCLVPSVCSCKLPQVNQGRLPGLPARSLGFAIVKELTERVLSVYRCMVRITKIEYQNFRRQPTLRAFVLRSEEGLTLETSASLSLDGRNLTLISLFHTTL